MRGIVATPVFQCRVVAVEMYRKVAQSCGHQWPKGLQNTYYSTEIFNWIKVVWTISICPTKMTLYTVHTCRNSSSSMVQFLLMSTSAISPRCPPSLPAPSRPCAGRGCWYARPCPCRSSWRWGSSSWPPGSSGWWGFCAPQWQHEALCFVGIVSPSPPQPGGGVIIHCLFFPPPWE